MRKKIIPLIIGIVIACMVMAVASVFAIAGAFTAEKASSVSTWSQPFNLAESMKIIDLDGDGQNELFIQGSDSVSVFDGAGNPLYSYAYTTPKTTLGDVTGDKVEDIVVFYPGSVDVISQGQISTIATDLSLGTPARAAVIQFASGPQIILGDTTGDVQSLSASGQLLWMARDGGDEIRGLDDTRIQGQTFVAIANRVGLITVYDEQGNQLWKQDTETLRRMRAYDLNGDGTSEILFGGEYGAFTIYNAADGTVLYDDMLGQAISEIREVELNGDPSGREIIVGGKSGGVWAFDYTGIQLWSDSMSDKVTEIAGIDITGDGTEEAVLGDDSGQLSIFNTTGSRINLPSHSSGITRIDVGKLNGQRSVAISDYTELTVNQVSISSLPGFRYTPLIVGLIVAAVILVMAGIVTSLPQKPETKVSFQDTSQESLEAQRHMLKESIADVERLRGSGEMSGEAYLARLKRLRADLAENEVAFKVAGYSVKIETFQCPQCGGTLELGMDKCEYCGEVIFS